MMNITLHGLFRGLAVLPLMALTVAAAIAQNVEVIDEIRFTSNDQSDGKPVLTYGFGSAYSDSTDFSKGEEIYPPAFPPEGFYAFFSMKDKQGGTDYGLKDVRGVPDTVKVGGRRFFSQSYIIRIQRYRGQEVTINVPFPLRRGLDSLVFKSVQPGFNFSATFTERGSVLIPNAFIETLSLTIYYDYERAAAVPLARETGALPLNIMPNPTHGSGGVTIGGIEPGAARLLVTNLLGMVVVDRAVSGTPAEVIDPIGMASGAYMVRLLDRNGMLLRQGRLVLTR